MHGYDVDSIGEAQIEGDFRERIEHKLKPNQGTAASGNGSADTARSFSNFQVINRICFLFISGVVWCGL